MTARWYMQFLFIAIICVVLLQCNNTTAFALKAHGEPGAGPSGTSVGEVWIDDTLILKLYSIGNASVHYKAQAAAKKLNKAFSKNLLPSQIYIEKNKDGYSIIAKNENILTVTPYQAHLHHSNPKDLALLWTGRIRSTLQSEQPESTLSANVSHPSTKSSTTYIAIPQGVTRTISIPNISQITEMKSSDPSIAKTKLKLNSMQIYGEKPGTTKVSLQWGTKLKEITITVKDVAGIIPPQIETLVTGWPARGSFVKTAALEALSKEILRKPGTKLSVNTNELFFPQQLNEGVSVSNHVSVRITGNGLVPVQGKVQLKVINFAIQKEDTAYLLVSNKPEFIKQPGVVFSETLLDDRPTRFLFHHANALPDNDNLLFNIKISNKTEMPSKIHLMEGIAGPSSDEVLTGHVATYQFLTSFLRGEGKVINLAPNSEHILFSKWLPKRDVTAGIYQFKVLEGSLPTVSIEARDSSKIGMPLNDISPPSPKEIYSHAKGVFDNPDIKIEREHIIGNGFTFISIGKKPFLKELFTGEPNYGNYGVIYQIRVAIKNTTNETRTARINFVPTAGVARGIFKLENKIIQTPMIAPFKPFTLSQYDILPGETKEVNILTTPEGGSFYPVNIVVES